MDRHQATYVMTTHVTLDLTGSRWALLDGDAGWIGIETGMIDTQCVCIKYVVHIYIGQLYMPAFLKEKIHRLVC